MEVGVRFLLFLQLLLRWFMTPLVALRWRRLSRGTPPPPPPPPDDRLLALSASRLAECIRNKEVRSEDAVRAYVRRLRQVNPALNAVVQERFEAALEEARAADRRVAEGRRSAQQLSAETPLLGVPFTVKESCSLKGMSYCVGTLLRRGVTADYDGEAVANLRKAGAIPLAVTSTPELCLSWESNNLVTGRTNNPFDLRRTPGGSSGGEAALLGAGASLLGVASDIAGSIRIPAHFTGIFGHKPTPGYVSLQGHYPLSEDRNFQRYLVLGPLARYAEDLRPALKAMAGDTVGPLRLDEEVNLSDLKVFYQEDAGFSLVLEPVHKEIRARLLEAAQYLSSQFGVPLEKGNFKDLEDSVEISVSVFFGMKGIPNLLQDPKNPKKQRSAALEVAKAMLGVSEYSLPAMGFTALYATNMLIPRNKHAHYCQRRDALRTIFQERLGENGVFLYPTYPTAAGFHDEVYAKAGAVHYTMVFNVLGMPSTHVPLGRDSQGMPIGVQVVAAPHMDRLCLAVAEELQRGFGGWSPPSTAQSAVS